MTKTLWSFGHSECNRVNPTVLRKAKIVCNFGLSECSRVKCTSKIIFVEPELQLRWVLRIILRCIIFLISHFISQQKHIYDPSLETSFQNIPCVPALEMVVVGVHIMFLLKTYL